MTGRLLHMLFIIVNVKCRNTATHSL